jgi:hypothetical protein
MVELGWNKSGEYPRMMTGRISDPLTNDAQMVRLPDFYRQEWKTGLQPWWEITPRRRFTDFRNPSVEGPSQESSVEDKIATATVLVDDAVERLLKRRRKKSTGIPTLKERQNRGAVTFASS